MAVYSTGLTDHGMESPGKGMELPGAVQMLTTVLEMNSQRHRLSLSVDFDRRKELYASYSNTTFPNLAFELNVLSKKAPT